MPRYSNDISLGNILSIISAFLTASAAVVYVTIAYATTDAVATQNSKKLAALEATLASLENRLRQIEQGDARDAERISAILTVLGRVDTRIDNRLNRLERERGSGGSIPE